MKNLQAKEKNKTKEPLIKNILSFFEPSNSILKNKKVILDNNVLVKSLVYYATTQKIQGTMEIMGWLAGTIENDTINVKECYVGNCQSSNYFTELDPIETIKMRNMAKKDGLILVGQWHCHPGISTNPSGEDRDTLNTLKQFGMTHPVMLIVNDKDFWLGTLDNNKLKRFDFIIPENKNDKLNLNLAYINGEYKYPEFDLQNDIEQEDEFAIGFMIQDFFISGLKVIVYPLAITLTLTFKILIGIFDFIEESITYIKTKQYKNLPKVIEYEISQLKLDIISMFKKKNKKVEEVFTK